MAFAQSGYVTIASAQNVGTVAGGILLYAVYVHQLLEDTIANGEMVYLWEK